MLPRLVISASVIAATACQPSLPYSVPSTSAVTAVFDPTVGKIPLPNDLVFSSINSACPPPANTSTDPQGACAQAELLASFRGVFPNDQEVAITIDFAQTNFDARGKPTQVAPDLDLTSFGPATVFVLGSTPTGIGEIPIEPLVAADYVKFDDHGTLTLHHQGRTPWQEGSYAVYVRGGASGVKTLPPAGDTQGIPIEASQVFHLIEQGLDMTDPKNLGLLRAQAGSAEKALELGTQLNGVIALYKAFAFPQVDLRFPHEELAALTTFKIAPAVTIVPIDPARGLAPLPFDLLRDVKTHKLTLVASCALAGSSLGADGKCKSPGAAGFQALDGFSTTGAILAPTSELIQANTVKPTSLMLYDLSVAGQPVLVDATTLIHEPCEFTSAATEPNCTSPTALSPVIALQPSGATAGDGNSVFRTRPLKDNTDYAVVITTDVHDKAGKPIGSGTVAKILRFKNPIIVADHSALLGIDDTTALALETMRLQLKPVFALFPDASKIAIAYTFHTQTILSQAAQLAALPYLQAPATALPVSEIASKTPLEAFTKYGVDPARVPGTAADAHIDEILEFDINTFNALDPATGAFLADPTQAMAERIHVLVATPKPTNPKLVTCSGPLAGLAPLKCAPLMVFRHGFGGGRAAMLTVADSNAAEGMVTVAIDAAKHGDRSFCTSGTTGATSGCNGGAACTPLLPAGAQGDANPLGTCGDAGFFKRPVSSTCTNACAANTTDGIAAVSGNYLISGNFFRTRDSMRQDLIDESQLIRAVAFAPTEGVPTPHALFNHMASPPHGVVIDPLTIYFTGQSLGAIQGAMDVAANPRISKAVFNVGGGTVVDVFTNSPDPAFKAATAQLLAGREGADLLKFLVVAKTVLDPAEPINFIGHLTDETKTLPNLLPPLGGNIDGSVRQAKKQRILVQIAHCDAVVPNPFNIIFASNVPTGTSPGQATLELFAQAPFTNDPDCALAAKHGFLTDWTSTLAAKAQSDLAKFVTDNTFTPPPLQVP